MGSFLNEADNVYFTDPQKKSELLELVKNPCTLVAAEHQPRLFQPEYVEVLFEYLLHHSLYEEHQPLLFEEKNEKIMEFFIERWGLCSACEAKLCEPQYRQKWLLKYLTYHHFIDSNNELLLFNDGMDKFRRFYICQTEFYCRQAELKLLEPQYLDDLHLYIELRRRFFKEQVEQFLEKADPNIVARYKKLNQY